MLSASGAAVGISGANFSLASRGGLILGSNTTIVPPTTFPAGQAVETGGPPGINPFVAGGATLTPTSLTWPGAQSGSGC